MSENTMLKLGQIFIGQGAIYLIKLALARLEYLAPSEFNLATGKLLRLLASRHEGLDKQQLLRSYYPEFDVASPMRQRSLETCLNKLIQRARLRYLKFGIDIHFCKSHRRWTLIPSADALRRSSKVFPPADKYQAF